MHTRQRQESSKTIEPASDSASSQAMIRWSKAVAIFTLLLVLTSAVSDLFICQQYSASISQQEDNRAQLQASIVFDGMVVVPINGADGKTTTYGFAAKFHNYGGTRTSSFISWESAKYFDTQVPNSQDFFKPYVNVDLRNSIIGPSSDMILPAIVVPIDDLTKASQGKGILVAWGHSDWSDIFTKKPKENKFLSCSESQIYRWREV